MKQEAIDDSLAALTAHKFAEATNLSLISINSEGNIEYANPSACSLFGYSKQEMLGKPITIIIPERMRGAQMAGFARVTAGEKPNLGGKTVEVSAVRSDGTEFPIEITLSIWQGTDGLCAGAVIKDISERREREGRLLRLASQDTLTGLHNRHQFMALISERIERGGPLALIMIDLDGFKEVNDIHGHGVGDSLLQAVGVRLPYMLGPDAAVARLGGDEFAVILPGIGDPLECGAEAGKILEAFAKPFRLGGLVLVLGASLGIAIAPNHGRDAEELLASADFALYRAKDSGGRCYRMFDHSMRSESQARRATRDDLRRALNAGELEMHYQPQIEMATGEVIGFEALIRWRHPQRGLLSPTAFLPALEQSSLALEIGWWTLDEACSALARLNVSGSNYTMAVNLFPTQFRALDLLDRVAETIETHGISPECVELEVTEEVTINGDERAFNTLSSLRELGVGVAFDDFGTGFASLSSLQRYPLTKLKIDRSFVSNIDHSRSDAAITKALIAMSADLGLKTVAEGIETPEQQAALMSIGCSIGQGYRFGRPMSEIDLRAFLGRSLSDRRVMEPGAMRMPLCRRRSRTTPRA